MNIQMMVMILLMLVVVLGMWQSRRMRKYISYSYTSASNQSWDGIVKTNGKIVVIDKMRFYLLPEYSTNRQYGKGLSSFFPTKITHYDFVWNSRYPVDHRTGKPAMLSPEAEDAIDNESALRDLAGSQRQTLSTRGRLTGLDKWMPYIMIGTVCGVLYCVYMMSQIQANDQVTQHAIIDIYETFNKMGIAVGQ